MTIACNAKEDIFRGTVHPKIKLAETHLQAIQDVDEFVCFFIITDLEKNVALYHLLTNTGSSAVNGCRLKEISQ